MILDPEGFIPVEVARRSEIARQAYPSTSRHSRSTRRSRFIAVMRREPGPAESV